MQWYCPDCFAEVAREAARCPRCGADLANPGRDYEQSLIKALRHPLPDRQLLAAQVLGARRARQAVPRLIEVIQETRDPYLAAEAITALARIGDPAGLAVVDPAFTDFDVGRWSGTAAAEVIRRFGALDEAPGVERREDFERRLLAVPTACAWRSCWR